VGGALYRLKREIIIDHRIYKNGFCLEALHRPRSALNKSRQYDHTRFVDCSLIGHAPFPFHETGRLFKYVKIRDGTMSYSALICVFCEYIIQKKGGGELEKHYRIGDRRHMVIK
jgi:hypothetical protein